MIDLAIRLPLARFTLDVETSLAGPSVAILGPSGSGKTSLLESIAGLRPRVSGRIAIEDEALLDSAAGRRLAPERRRVGYVPQDALLFPHLDVQGNVRFGLRPGPDDARFLAETIEILEVGALLPRSPATLSGGERQRVALARALATRPRVLLLDEPLAAVDTAHRERILPYLLSVRDALHVPFLYVTHNAGEAEALAAEVLILREGRVMAQGPAAEILVRRDLAASDPEAALENVLEGTLDRAEDGSGAAAFHLAGGEIFWVPAGTPGGRALYAVSPEDILLSADPLPKVSARNVMGGVVVSIEHLGQNALIRARAQGFTWRVLVTPDAARDLRLSDSSRVWLAVKAQAFRRLK